MRHSVIIIVGLALAFGCAEVTVTDYPRTAATAPENAAEDGAENGSEALAEPAEPPSPAWVGEPCTDASDDACAENSGVCLNDDLLAAPVASGPSTPGDNSPQIEIPNGMCSGLCATNEDCGPNAICYDGTALTGTAIKLCLRTCVHLAQCRWTEGYSCFVPSGDAAIDRDDTGVCLPNTAVVSLYCTDQQNNCND